MTPNAAAALDRLENIWRERSSSMIRHSAGGFELRRCADELATLRASLAQEQGEVVAEVACNVFGDPFVKFNDGSKLSDHIGTKLFAHPAAVDEAMVRRACDAFLKDNMAQRVVDAERMRAALTAALLPATSGEAP